LTKQFRAKSRHDDRFTSLFSETAKSITDEKVELITVERLVTQVQLLSDVRLSRE